MALNVGCMCFICFVWVIKQELLPTRHINLLANNYIQCFSLRKKCKPMGNIYYRNTRPAFSNVKPKDWYFIFD